MTSMFFELSSADIQLKFKVVPIDEISASEGSLLCGCKFI